ncbi:MAG: hypothetical protein VX550_01225, partial [Bacteroidota bacterium]|nr:hypothetical protein [Bacteroidota bacterium]
MSNNSTNKKRKVLGGNIIIVFLASLPYLFHFYQFVDAEDYVDSDFVNSLTEPFGGDLYVALWVFFQKLFPFLITLIWFLTCKHWWYHA